VKDENEIFYLVWCIISQPMDIYIVFLYLFSFRCCREISFQLVRKKEFFFSPSLSYISHWFSFDVDKQWWPIQGCQISWISQESPDFEIFLLAENLLISGADFRYFLLILVLFPDYLSASLLSTIWWNISWVNKKVYNNSTKITRGYWDLFSNGIYLFVTDLFPFLKERVIGF